MTKTVALILTVLLITGAFFGVCFALRRMARAIELNERKNTRVRKWPTLRGSIISSTLDDQTYYEPDGVQGPTTSFVTVRFTYEVQGVVYSGKQTLMSHQAPGSHYPLEHPMTATVYYDPANPRKARIEPKNMSIGRRLIAIGLFPVMLLMIGLTTGVVILALIKVWALSEGQPW